VSESLVTVSDTESLFDAESTDAFDSEVPAAARQHFKLQSLERHIAGVIRFVSETDFDSVDSAALRKRLKVEQTKLMRAGVGTSMSSRDSSTASAAAAAATPRRSSSADNNSLRRRPAAQPPLSDSEVSDY